MVVLAAGMLLAPPIATADITTDLVAYYTLDGDATDSSGHGNHGTLMGPVPTADRFGYPVSALRFDGVDDLVEIPDSADFNFNQPLTLTAWIILSDTTPGGIVGQWGEGGFAGDAYLLAIADARLQATFSEPPVVAVIDPVPIASGTWRFVAMTYDGVTVQLYMDGVPTASGPVAATPEDSDQPVRIGLENIGSGDLNYIYAAIDDVRIYHRALTADDVQEIFNLVFQDGFESGDTSAWTGSAP